MCQTYVTRKGQNRQFGEVAYANSSCAHVTWWYTPCMRNGDKLRCPAGHIYTDSNTHMYAGRRYCKQCRDSRRESTGSVPRTSPTPDGQTPPEWLLLKLMRRTFSKK